MYKKHENLKKMAENRELEFTEDWMSTQKKKMSTLIEGEAYPTYVFKKVLIPEGIDKNFHVVNGAE
jgi:hypothetical protein